MTRGKQDKLYRTFTKGLITEAGFLTFPEDASIDELNTVIYRKGNRSRRAGIDYEINSTEINYSATATNDDVTNEYFWRAPGDESGLNFLVIQVGSTLYFFDSDANPLSSGKKSFTVDLLPYKSPTATDTDIKTNYVHMSSGKGILFVCQNYMDPVTVEYDAETDTLKTTKVYILMRDFDGVDDGLPNDAEPSNLSKEHHYNLLNQGWVNPSKQQGDPLPDGAVTPPDGSDDSGEDINPYTGRRAVWRALTLLGGVS